MNTFSFYAFVTLITYLEFEFPQRSSFKVMTVTVQASESSERVVSSKETEILRDDATSGYNANCKLMQTNGGPKRMMWKRALKKPNRNNSYVFQREHFLSRRRIQSHEQLIWLGKAEDFLKRTLDFSREAPFSLWNMYKFGRSVRTFPSKYVM